MGTNPLRVRLELWERVLARAMNAPSRRRWPVLTCAGAALLLLWTPAPARAQGDGPRAYQFAPAGTHVFSVYGMFTRGNQSADPAAVVTGSDLTVNNGVLFYAHPLVIGGHLGGAFAVVPFGEVEGTLSLSTGDARGRSTGLADVQVGWVQNLVGPRAAGAAEYVRLRPGFTLSSLVKVTAPTGDYSPDRTINLGANRWSVQVGAPLTRYRGRSFVDPRLTTFELLPSVTFFTANTDLSSAGSVRQKAYVRLEGHVTQGLSPRVWVSLDTRYSGGGETTTDGVDDGNVQHSWGLGGTLAVSISRRVSVKASYGDTLARNDDGMKTGGLRIVASVTF